MTVLGPDVALEPSRRGFLVRVYLCQFEEADALAMNLARPLFPHFPLLYPLYWG